MTPLQVCALMYQFTGKERDAESNNDYFFAPNNIPNPFKPTIPQVCTTALTGIVKCSPITDFIPELPTCGQVAKGLAYIAHTGAAYAIFSWASPPAWAVPEIPAGGAAAIGAAELTAAGGAP